MSGFAGNKQSLIEVAGIAGIISIFAFFEVFLGFFNHAVATLNSASLMIRGFAFTLFIAFWVGTAVYSIYRHREQRRETVRRAKEQESLVFSKITDAVTGLPNALGFNLVLDQTKRLSSGTSVTVAEIILGDVDAIRCIHGLEAVASKERELVEVLCGLVEGHDMVARGRRAQFYVLLSDDEPIQHEDRVNRFLKAVEAVNHSKLVAKGAKVFIGVVPLDALQQLSAAWSARDIIQRAEFSVGCAQKNNNDQASRFNSTMESLLRDRMFVESSLEDAIVGGHIVPYFQPQIDLTTNEIIGFEVLARWRRPNGSILLPHTFFSTAEDMGLLAELTLSILDQACKLAKPWPKHLTIAFNISPTDLRDTKLTRQVISMLKDHDFDPRRIEIEITENAFIEKAQKIAGVIGELKRAGILISIDEFGTGYSSLHHLPVLPFDKIKIDQSFVKNMVTDVDSRMIVKSIVELGNSLGLPTIAAGVEAVQNNDMLLELGCSLGQGYLFAKPLPGEEVAGFLERYNENMASKQHAA